MTTVSRNAQVLHYLLELDRRIDATKHLKLAYLADVFGRRFLGHPITEFSYHWHDHGPFDSAFYGARDELEFAEVATEQTTEYPGTDYEARTLVALGGSVDYDFSPGERWVLDYVYRTYGDLPLDGLLEIVYRTPPMERVEKQGEPLPMEIVDGEGTAELGFDLEELAAADERVNEGRFVEWGEFRDELRAEIGRGRGGPSPAVGS